MQICLLSPPTFQSVDSSSGNRHSDVAADRIPLGILALAAVAKQAGHTCSVVDLSYMDIEASRTDDGLGFEATVTRRIAQAEYDLFGLGTLCTSYPSTLRIAQALRKAHPLSTIVLGGPQASVVDVATLLAYPEVDIIVRGEADRTFPALLGALQSRSALEYVPGITFRHDGRVFRNHDAPVVLDLDELPLPAFDTIQSVANLPILPLELGRGCPFACTFCSTNDFFRRKFRLKSPAALIGHMRELYASYGTRTFILVHDMFTVDKRRVVEFCNAMIASGDGFEWSCSARTDSVDDELLGLMAKAGCIGLFFGIETGSPRMQRIIDKRLDLDEASRAVNTAVQIGMHVTVSTIIGYPEEEQSDVDLTVNWLLDSMRHKNVKPQVGLLAPLAGTPILQSYREQLVLDNVFNDFAYTGWFEASERLSVVRHYPDIFPNFYALPTRVPRANLFELKLFLHAAFQRFRWLLVAIHQEVGDVPGIFSDWLGWRSQPSDLVQYYVSTTFHSDFLDFLRERLEAGPLTAPAVRALAAAEQKLTAPGASLQSAVSVNTSADGYPMLAPGTEICELPADIGAVIAGIQMKNTEAVQYIPTRYIVHSSHDSRRIVRLNARLEQILTACDGTRSAQSILEASLGMSASAADANGFFESLERENLVIFARATGC